MLEMLDLSNRITIIYMGMILVILVLLLGMIIVLIPSSRRKKKKAKEIVAAPVVIEEVRGIDPKTIAAIMAAVSAAAGVGVELKFSAIRHNTGFKNAWSDSSTLDIINTRQLYL